MSHIAFVCTYNLRIVYRSCKWNFFRLVDENAPYVHLLKASKEIHTIFVEVHKMPQSIMRETYK